MTKKEEKTQRALGTLPAVHYLLVVMMAEFEAGTPQYVQDQHELVVGDTSYFEIEDFDFPITSKQNFNEQVLRMFTREAH